MTTLFLEPFSQYGFGTENSAAVNYMLQGPWAAVSTGRCRLQVPSWDNSGIIALGHSNNGLSSSEARRALPATKTKLVSAFRFAIDSLPTADGDTWIFEWRTVGNTLIAALGLGSTGRLYLTNGSYTQVATTSGPVVVPQNFHHLEMLLDLDNQTFTLRVDDSSGTGTPAISATGLSLTGPIGQINCLNTQEFGRYSWMRDLKVRDTAGSVNNGFNGDTHVIELAADADTTTMGWTPLFYKEFDAGILWGASMSAASSTQTDLGSGDFTLEGFFRFISLPGSTSYTTIFSKWDTANNKRSYRFLYGSAGFNANCLQFDISTDGTAGTVTTKIQYPWIPSVNTWYHIALVRTSGELLLFVNGNQLGLPIADSATYYAGTEPLGIGTEIQGTNTVVANTSFSGWMDETRMTVGFARYNAPFTPSGPFPRGSGSDAHWSNVALLAGYNSGIQDESSFARTLTAQNGSFQYTVSDGPAIGDWSTVGFNKTSVDDNTYMQAPFLPATGTLTMTVQPANNDTVTVGTKNGSTPAVYTFKTSIASAFDVLIDTTAQNTLLNLYNAINAGTGSGTKYGASTTANFDVTATQLPVGQLLMTANTFGTGGNSIATSATGTAASWGGTHLAGGVNIPGPSNFKVQRPPPFTTQILSAQLAVRMWKSDSGPCAVQPALVGPLGGLGTGAAHNVTVSPSFYGDIVETDPDTSGPITPTTIINGAIQLNRTA